MATNKHAVIRYQALDKCFSNFRRRFYIDDLIEACNESIYNFTGINEGVKRRQIYSDIAFMESEQRWCIPLERIKDGRKVYFRYEDKEFSINNQPLTDSEVRQLRETILTLNRFKGMPQFEWMEEMLSKLEDRFHLKGAGQSVISFESNPYLIGLGHLSTLFNAIINKQTLEISYKGFNKQSQLWIIHPYHIKQYNSKWFLFGKNEEHDTITNLPLDRIESISNSECSYIENKIIDFYEYFDDVIGVTIPPESVVEKVLLSFSLERSPYVLSKPIHSSQKCKDKELGIVEISVIPNKELESLIMSFGNHVEVIAPESLRCRIKQQIEELNNKYNKCS